MGDKKLYYVILKIVGSEDIHLSHMDKVVVQTYTGEEVIEIEKIIADAKYVPNLVAVVGPSGSFQTPNSKFIKSVTYSEE
ncbi:MAG: hypothetical protein AB9921_06055 [Erysipelotrichaceae bacterium]